MEMMITDRLVSGCLFLVTVFLLGGGCHSTPNVSPKSRESRLPMPDEPVGNMVSGDSSSPEEESTSNDGDGTSTGNVQLFPGNLFYRPYLASTRFPQFRLSRIRVTSSTIDDTGNDRYDLRAGHKAAIVRFYSNWQISFFGGLKSVFDIDNSFDNIGWDGVFGASLERKINQKTAMMVEYEHQSAHIGDELTLRTGRDRIDYTRQEYNLGVTRRFPHDLRLYTEGGFATTLNNKDIQEPFRVQAGFEYGIPDNRERETKDWGTFVAGDFESMEERNWQIDTNIQTGFYFLRDHELWRIGFEFRDGRVPYGEFSQTDETYIGLVLWATFSS